MKPIIHTLQHKRAMYNHLTLTLPFPHLCRGTPMWASPRMRWPGRRRRRRRSMLGRTTRGRWQIWQLMKTQNGEVSWVANVTQQDLSSHIPFHSIPSGFLAASLYWNPLPVAPTKATTRECFFFFAKSSLLFLEPRACVCVFGYS